MLRHIHARPEQPSFPNTLTQLISDALRAAAVAPTLSDALDVAGAALSDISSIVRNEGSSEQPTCAAGHSLEVARRTADETLSALDRISSVLEAIERLSCNNDAAIADLAGIARSLAEKQIERIDVTFSALAAEGRRHA